MTTSSGGFPPRRAQMSRALLARVGLEGFEERETSGLSGGELQRLAIAACLAREPRLLISDEATAMIDGPGRAEVVASARVARRRRDHRRPCHPPRSRGGQGRQHDPHARGPARGGIVFRAIGPPGTAGSPEPHGRSLRGDARPSALGRGRPNRLIRGPPDRFGWAQPSTSAVLARCGSWVTSTPTAPRGPVAPSQGSTST